MVFYTSFDCGSTNNGVTRVSIKCSGFAGVFSSVSLGHNSCGSSLNTSLIALSKDQVSDSNSEPVSLEDCCNTISISECMIGVGSMVPAGCGFAEHLQPEEIV